MVGAPARPVVLGRISGIQVEVECQGNWRRKLCWLAADPAGCLPRVEIVHYQTGRSPRQGTAATTQRPFMAWRRFRILCARKAAERTRARETSLGTACTLGAKARSNPAPPRGDRAVACDRITPLPLSLRPRWDQHDGARSPEVRGPVMVGTRYGKRISLVKRA